MFTKQEIYQELEFRRCAKDPIYFFEKYWKIQVPGKAVNFVLREPQKQALKVWEHERYSITLKARQIGWSTLVAALAFHRVFFRNNYEVVMLSENQDKATDLLAKSKYGYEFLPEWMKAKGPRRTTNQQATLTFDNHSKIESLPTLGNPARGKTPSLVLIDEWAMFENPEEAWASIQPSLDIGGQAIGLSTAKGSGNFFHQMWIGAVTGSNNFKPMFFPYDAVPDRNDEWYERQKRDLQEWQLHQEFPRTPDEAFIKSGNPVFDVDALMDLDKETESPTRGFLVPDPNRPDRNFSLQLASDGNLHMWQAPRMGVRYVIGADVAEGSGGDYSVCHVIDTSTGFVAAKWRGQIAPDLFGSDVLYKLGWHYNHALVGVEANNHGLTTLVALRDTKYGRIYERHDYDKKTGASKGKKMGWFTSAPNKRLMIDELQKALRGDEPEITVRDTETIGELLTFIYTANGKMEGQPYDDQVISLAIANQMRKHSFTIEYSENNGPAPYSLDWWAEETERAEANTGSWVIGA